MIIDINSNEILYELDNSVGVRDKRSYWELYLEVKENVLALVNNTTSNKPAVGGVCKLCSWYDSCTRWAIETDDLTGLFYVGRSTRDRILSDIGIGKIQDSINIDVNLIMKKKNDDKALLKGIGQKTLEKIIARANVIKKIKAPVIYKKIDFPNVSYELFFDIEDDPTQQFTYLHGIYIRSDKGEKYTGFVAKQVNSMAEKRAWSDFWDFIGSLPRDDYAVYYYSSHEKANYRSLQKKFPDVIIPDSLEAFFDKANVMDLYNIILDSTDWPVGSYSLKSIAMYLGFEWRDDSPSGALSIQWFNEFLNTHDAKILNRILEYNEDDCKATMIIKDKLKQLSDNLLQ
jgi:uncharacterized protein